MTKRSRAAASPLVGIYCRVSTDRQEDNVRLPSQLDACRRPAATAEAVPQLVRAERRSDHWVDRRARPGSVSRAICEKLGLALARAAVP